MPPALPAIPRASTYPLLGGSSSPSASSLPTWRRGAERGADRRLLGSRLFVLVTVALFSLLLVGVPTLYSSFSSRDGGISSASSSSSSSSAAPAGGGGADLPALAAGAIQPSLLRRAASLWPEAGLPLHLRSSQTAQVPKVEYKSAGNIVALADALNISAWQELPLYHASTPPSTLPQAVNGSGSGSAGGGQHAPAGGGSVAGQRFPAACPQGDIRLFIGVTSRCCSPEAQAKRDAIRRTWLQHAKQHLPGVTVRFILAQPSSEADLHAALELLRGETQQHGDIVIVPGQDVYRNLPSKTLQLLHYAMTSDCRYTHVLKADDDVHLRPQLLVDIITGGRFNFSVEVQHDGSGTFDGQPAQHFHSPWMRGMYVGQLDSEKRGGVYPGWAPNRDPASKWYLPEADLPDAWAPLGVRWCSGWGYMLSRDLAEFITNTALAYAAVPERKPLWWGRMPWEDIMVGTMLSGVARVHHHDGFKAAWQSCDTGTVLKHLDNDAPVLQDGLYAQEVSGLWSKKEVVCSSGVFQPNNHSDWRIWRNAQPDNQLHGFM